MLNKVTIESTGFSSTSDAEYKLKKLRLSLENGSVSNSTVFAMNDTANFEDTDDKPNPENNKNEQEKDEKSIKENYKNFIDSPTVVNGVKTAQALAYKAKDFTKSSFAKINAIPENRRAAVTAKMISDGADDPKSLADQLKSFLGKAGKGVGFAALTVACLPAAAGALVANDKIGKNDKKRAAEEIQREIIRLDSKLKEAESSGDADLQADLLIAKKAAENSYNKIKYNLDTRGL